MFQFNGYVLDVARGCLRTADREIELRPKSFEVLRCLVENSGRLVTKDELFKAVWPDVTVSDEALTQCISEVREAIGDRAQTMIKTMPRRGYRFAAPVSKHRDEVEARHRSAPIAPLAYDTAERLSGKPSIAVLPFVNLDNDPQQDYFSDGITGDIITELSRFSDLLVIARSSAFQYKGKAIDVRQVGRELGVRYVLEGSVRRDDKRIRITAELIDATNGAHRWADRYDRELKDTLAVQDEVVRGLVSVLQVRVVEAEAERALLKPPAAWEAYDYYLRGAEAWATGFSQRPMTSFYEARRCLERSITIDPSYAPAYVVFARSYTYAYVEPRNTEYLNPTTLARAEELVRTAVQLDATLSQARAVLGFVLMFKRRHQDAVAEFEQAFALNPNFSDHNFGLCLLFAGQPERAIEVMQASTRLEPFQNATRLAYTGNACYMLGRYEEAVTSLRESAWRMPNLRITQLWLAAAYAQLGRLDEARAAADEVRRIEPDFAIERWKLTAVYKRPEDSERLFDGLRKAGLPDT
jgi:adenylate cyclase